MRTYYDTSFLLPLYLKQEWSEIVSKIVADRASALPITAFGRFELRNALRMCVFLGKVRAKTMEKALKVVEADEAAGVLRLMAIDWATMLVQAEKLSASFTRKDGHRALDILHVAAAVSIGSSDFGSFDIKQRKLAATAGLTVLPKKMP